MDYKYKAGKPDVLPDVLGTLRLNSRVFSYSQLSALWALELPPGPFAYFHVVERSGGWIQLKGETEAQPVAGGDLVVILHGGGHIVASNLRVRPLTLKQFLKLRDEEV